MSFYDDDHDSSMSHYASKYAYASPVRTRSVRDAPAKQLAVRCNVGAVPLMMPEHRNVDFAYVGVVVQGVHCVILSVSFLENVPEMWSIE